MRRLGKAEQRVLAQAAREGIITIGGQVRHHMQAAERMAAIGLLDQLANVSRGRKQFVITAKGRASVIAGFR